MICNYGQISWCLVGYKERYRRQMHAWLDMQGHLRANQSHPLQHTSSKEAKHLDRDSHPTAIIASIAARSPFAASSASQHAMHPLCSTHQQWGEVGCPQYLLLSWAPQHTTCPPGELGRGTRAGRAASQIPAMQATWSRPPEHPPHHLLECPPVVGKGAWCPPGPPSLPVRERHSLGCTSGLPCAGEESSFCD